MITKTFYAPRYKKNGTFFKWLQLCDDGYGFYYSCSTNFDPDSLPLMLLKPELPQYVAFHEEMNTFSKKINKKEEIDFVVVTLQIYEKIYSKLVGG